LGIPEELQPKALRNAFNIFLNTTLLLYARVFPNANVLKATLVLFYYCKG